MFRLVRCFSDPSSRGGASLLSAGTREDPDATSTTPGAAVLVLLHLLGVSWEKICVFLCFFGVQDVSKMCPLHPLWKILRPCLSFVFGLVFPNVFLPRCCLPRIARVTLATLPWAWWGVCGLRSHLSPTLRPSPWKIIIVWLVVYLPLWKIWKSVGMMKFPTEWHVIKFHGSSHHQAVNISSSHADRWVKLEMCFLVGTGWPGWSKMCSTERVSANGKSSKHKVRQTGKWQII